MVISEAMPNRKGQTEKKEGRSLGMTPPARGIGVLNEKSIHQVLKYYIEPDVSLHEVSVEGYIADIMRDDGIYEIQSRHFYKMKTKLTKLLSTHKVTVVYPVARTKWINWVEESGQIVRRRKSPKSGLNCHILAELYGIRELLVHGNLSFAVVRFDAEDYRLASGEAGSGQRGEKSQNSQKGRKAQKAEQAQKGRENLSCMPVTWVDEIWFGGTRERGLDRLLPDLAEEFTSWEFGRAGRFPRKIVHRAMKVLRDAGVIECVGKRGRLFVYRVLPCDVSESCASC